MGASHNVAILPPLKGKRLAFAEETMLRMFERVLVALKKRVRLRFDLQTAPDFYDFVYRLVQDFEGHQEVVSDGRYILRPQSWVSSFGEMYSLLGGRTVEDLFGTRGATVMTTTGGIGLRFNGTHVDFGNQADLSHGDRTNPFCRKNIEMESSTMAFVKSVAVGRTISSAADFGEYIEFSLDQRFNLGLHPNGFHLISTESPIESHRL
jgi:hypothetical protein